MSLTPAKVKALLGDLGKPTLRGVRRCPKCSTLNGTRGVSCKNSACNVVFKERGRRKGHSAEAVRLVPTGSSTSIALFSVRLRDRGPDYRGFIELPVEGSTSVPHCTVDTCMRQPQGMCVHARAASACVETASPLPLKNSVLNALAVSSEIKQAIWLLATATPGPLVQRVTKSVMVVKCQADVSRHPLGLLHLAFFQTTRNRSQPEHKFHCSCKAFKSTKGPGFVKEDSQRRCVHFYACLCAFSSDDQLAEEFAYYIRLLDTPIVGEYLVDPLSQLITIVSQPDEQALAALATTTQTVDITLTTDDLAVATDDPGHDPSSMTVIEDVIEESEGVEVVVDADGGVNDDEDYLEASEPKRHCADDDGVTMVTIGGVVSADTLVQASSALLTLQDADTSSVRTSPTKTANSTSAKCAVNLKRPMLVLDEQSIHVSFHQWLASITERINQTMHYQFDGSPEPLVFHAPQGFFDCLQQRISAGNKKKRLPNSTTGFIRRDALPLGMFTKYTWNITNILHVKQIFDTVQMPLEITRSFVENRDGTFDLYEAPPANEVNEMTIRTQPPIRPFELKTYIKVGNTTVDQKEPTPFIIEWIPDILPRCRIGELRIKFEYGHQRNGQIELRPSSTTNIQLQTIHIQ